MKEFVVNVWGMIKVIAEYAFSLIGLVFIIPGYVLTEIGKMFVRFSDRIYRAEYTDNGPNIVNEIVNM